MAKKRKHKKRFRKDVLALAIGLLVIAITSLVVWYSFPSSPNLPIPSLKDLANKNHISIGVHTSLDRLSDTPYKNIVTSQFSFITIDGEANWNFIHPTLSKYNYSKVDKLMTFANMHNMPVQIHHLIWGEQLFLPTWLKTGGYTSMQLLNIIHSYITNVVGHLKGRVAVWSVVNEVFSRNQHLYGLQDWWANNIKDGTAYVDDSYIWAHQVDPNAKLILNDFDNETENSVSNAEYNYIKAAQLRGVPIDGIGMQMHIDAANPPSTQDVIKNIKRFAAIGIPTYVTEFDVNLNSVKGSSQYKNQLEANITYDMVRACVESKACVSFDEFGVSDKDNTLKSIAHTNSHSYLFTSRYVPKLSFYSFRNALISQ